MAISIAIIVLFTITHLTCITQAHIAKHDVVGSCNANSFIAYYSLDPDILQIIPFIRSFESVQLILDKGQILISDIQAVLYVPSVEKDTDGQIILYLSADYEVVVDSNSVKVYDKNRNIVLSKIKEKGAKSDKDDADGNNSIDAPNRLLRKTNCGNNCGSIKTISNAYDSVNPGSCSFHTGIYGGFNPCNSPALTSVANFKFGAPTNTPGLMNFDLARF